MYAPVPSSEGRVAICLLAVPLLYCAWYGIVAFSSLRHSNVSYKLIYALEKIKLGMQEKDSEERESDIWADEQGAQGAALSSDPKPKTGVGGFGGEPVYVL